MGNAKLASNLSAKEYAGQVKARKGPLRNNSTTHAIREGRGLIT